METIESWYREWQVKLGGIGEKANEDARFVLPNACETRIMITMNVRELFHFFSLRMCSRAQWEIRKMAEQMFIHRNTLIYRMNNIRKLLDSPLATAQDRLPYHLACLIHHMGSRDCTL